MDVPSIFTNNGEDMYVVYGYEIEIGIFFD